MSDNSWVDVGTSAELGQRPVQEVLLGRTRIALTCKDGQFGAISGVCNHVGGPLGEGTLDGDYVVCPWHYWKFHRRTGEGEPGYEEDRVPAHDGEGRERPRAGAIRRRARSGAASRTRRIPLARTPQREPGPIRVARHLDHGDDRGAPALQHVRRPAVAGAAARSRRARAARRG